MKLIAVLLMLLLPGFQAIQVSIPKQPFHFTTDNLGNIYFVKDNVLQRLNKEGKVTALFSEKRFGKISSIDVTVPQKILVFYRDFSKILFLDNMLAPSGSVVALDLLSQEQASLACYSNNNNIWIYNQLNYELLRIDPTLNIKNRSGNLLQLTGGPVKPNFLAENNNQVFLNDPAKGILVFDIYGTFIKTIPLLGITEFQISDDHIYYMKENKYFSYDLRLIEEKLVQTPDSTFIKARVEKEALYLLFPDQLKIYPRPNGQ